MPVGKKGFDALKRRYENATIDKTYIGLNSNLDWEHISEVPNLLMESFTNGTFDDITICYSKFKNAAVQDPYAVQYLPVAKLEPVEKERDIKDTKSDYIFEPDTNTLLENLVPSILQTTFQKFLFDNRAGEHGARMSAMDKATENAEDLMNELKIFYNKARQEAITKELSEIVGGAAALGG
jgi:F-type H+-transporting ATPase subunit gamma